MTKSLATKVADSLKARGYFALVLGHGLSKCARVSTDADLATVEETIVAERIAQFSEVR